MRLLRRGRAARAAAACLNSSPRAMIAQAILASLLASATVTARRERRTNSPCTQSASGVVLLASERMSEVAPSTNCRRQ